MAITAGLLAMVFWGVAIFLAATASRKIGNILTLFWMQVFGLTLGSLYFAFNFQSFTLNRIPQFIPILVAIAMLQIIAYLSFYKGLEKGQVSLVSPLGASWGLITALLGVIFYRESLSSTQSLAILFIIVGIILISIDVPSLLKSKTLKLMTGLKEGILAMFGWGISLFLLVYPTRNLDWFLPAFLFRVILVALLSAYIVSLKKSFMPKKFPVWQLVTIGVFDMGAFMSLSFGMSGANSAIVAPIASSYAVVTILLATVFLKEKIQRGKAIGIASIISGLILISL